MVCVYTSTRLHIQGYKLVGIKVTVPSRNLATDHYAEHDGKPFFPKLVNFLSSSAVVAMVRLARHLYNCVFTFLAFVIIIPVANILLDKPLFRCGRARA